MPGYHDAMNCGWQKASQLPESLVSELLQQHSSERQVTVIHIMNQHILTTVLMLVSEKC